MIIVISIILFIFVVAFTAAWIWYFKYGMAAANANLYDQAIDAYNKSNYALAKELLIKAIKASPNIKDAHLKLGMVYLEEKDFTNAKQSFEKALKLAPKDFEVLYNYAFSMQMLNEFTAAIDNYKKALAENPQSHLCYLNIGLIEFKQTNYEKALEVLTKANNLKPDDTNICFYKTRCLDELCNWETEEEGKKVIDEYLKIIDIEDLPNTYGTILTKAYAKNGQINDAIKQCQNTLRKDPENAECYTLLGLMQLLKKDLSGAKGSLSTALSLQSSNSEVHEILSYTLCQQKNKCAVQRCRDKYKEIIKNFTKEK